MRSPPGAVQVKFKIADWDVKEYGGVTLIWRFVILDGGMTSSKGSPDRLTWKLDPGQIRSVDPLEFFKWQMEE